MSVIATKLPRGVRATAKGLVLPEGLAFEDWLEVGQQLAVGASMLAWNVGDWLFYGEFEYGKKYAEAAEDLGIDLGTARNWSSLAGRFDLSRRRDKLGPSFHAEVASLDPPTADRLLEQAEAEGWTRAQLRDAARAERERRQAPQAPAPGDNEPDGQHLPPPPAPTPPPLVDEPSCSPAGATAPPPPQLEATLSEETFGLSWSTDRHRMERWEAAAAAVGKGVHEWALAALDEAADAAAVS